MERHPIGFLTTHHPKDPYTQKNFIYIKESNERMFPLHHGKNFPDQSWTGITFSIPNLTHQHSTRQTNNRNKLILSQAFSNTGLTATKTLRHAPTTWQTNSHRDTQNDPLMKRDRRNIYIRIHKIPQRKPKAGNNCRQWIVTQKVKDKPTMNN